MCVYVLFSNRLIICGGFLCMKLSVHIIITYYERVVIFGLGEWYSCRGLAVVANSGVSTLGYSFGRVSR